MRTKILLLTAIFFCFTLFSKAQIKTGRYFLGGSGSYFHSTNDNDESVYGDIQLGKVFKNNTVAGIIGSYTSHNSYYTQTSRTKQFSAGLFYRKYKSLGKNFYFFGELQASYQYSKNIQEYFYTVNQNIDSKSNAVAIYFIPGISYNVWKRMQIELSMPNIANISYSHSKTIDSALPPNTKPQEKNTFSVNADLNTNLLNNFGIGFKFFIGR